MATFPRERIRLQIDTSLKIGNSAITDQRTAESPAAWKGTSVQFEIALFDDGELLDISNIQTLTFIAKDPNNKRGDLILQKSISQASMDLTLTQDAWDAKTGQHAVIQFNSSEMGIDLQGKDYRDLWLMVYGLTNLNEQVAFGAASLRVYETGIAGGPVTPVLGSNLIPGGAVYDGSGHYVFALTAGKVYDFAKGSDETSLANGTETLSASGRFTAQGGSVTLTGIAASPVTAAIRDKVFYTAEEINALIDGVVKAINKPGQPIYVQSPSGRWLVGVAATDDGEVSFPRIDRNAAP